MQIERAIGLATYPVVEVVWVYVMPVDTHRQLRMDELNRLAVVHGIRGAQYGVPVDDRLGGAFQRRYVEVAADPAGITDCVRRTAGCELIEEPQRLLAVRQRMRADVLCNLRRRVR